MEIMVESGHAEWQGGSVSSFELGVNSWKLGVGCPRRTRRDTKGHKGARKQVNDTSYFCHQVPYARLVEKDDLTREPMEPNWANQTLWTGDNLDIMRGMNSESVDLIYLDPPFNSNRDYAAPIGSAAAGAAFKDTWTLSDVDLAWHGEIAESEPALYAIIDAAGLAHGKGMKSYLTMMAVRLLGIRRILKVTGSLYLHCDNTAAHYLKMLLDSLLGQGSFRSQFTWRRTNAKGLAFKGYPNNADALLYFTKSDSFVWNRPFLPHDEDTFNASIGTLKLKRGVDIG